MTDEQDDALAMLGQEMTDVVCDVLEDLETQVDAVDMESTFSMLAGVVMVAFEHVAAKYPTYPVEVFEDICFASLEAIKASRKTKDQLN